MYNPLLKTEEFKKLQSLLEKSEGPAVLTGPVDSAKAMIISALSYAWKLVVAEDEPKARALAKNLHSLVEDCWYYPAKDFLFYQADTQGTLITRQRVQVIQHLCEEKSGIVVTTIDALMDRIEARGDFRRNVLLIRPGDELELEKLSGKLVSIGYERVPEVSVMGEFSIRGGIVDIYPFTVDNPVRVELWDTEVDSIRSFSAETQRSLENLTEVEIYPAKDHRTGEAGREASLLDYFSESDLLVLDEPDRMAERGRAVETEFAESFAARATELEKHGKLREIYEREGIENDFRNVDPRALIYSADEIMDRMRTGRTLAISALGDNLRNFSASGPVKPLFMDFAEVQNYRNSSDLLIKDLKKWQKEGAEILLLAVSRTRASRLASDLRDYGLKAYCPDPSVRDSDNEAWARENQGACKVLSGYLSAGFEYRTGHLILLTENDMFGNAAEVRRKRKRKIAEGERISRITDIQPGDYVVHERHGIGIYRGIERITSEGVTKDYIRVEYGDGGNLYLPATKLEDIQKYAGADAKKPHLNRLNGSEWQKTRRNVQKAVDETAKELVKLYAARSRNNGFKFGPDTVWQKEFEEMFPYEETADQVLAIDAVKADMESGRIMDRLICGDVGYGKTEIALRAAFKAVQDSKQVAYLAPTTILAQQIYNTFVERMKGFPVTIELLCRFRTSQQMKESISRLRSGRADIVIGTHRLLSKDVEFHDLGLLVVDEEQRFGVRHKERIKEMKQNVDVLTLSATPIPRTLHMSLAGIRDMSVLEEPPMDRLPIQTYVMEYNDELVREAIRRELNRNGQVYYVHNRVGNIAEIADHVASLVPEANVQYANGQMSENQLEDIMADFVNGAIDVLVSTTIIETGLDIPNANTLIIDDSDRLGLSQLYQLRGRVGRSTRTSYAFLMYRRGKMLTEESEKRLKAIREFTQLGSGIRIAMRDLEIRGAGNVLGAEQSGHMQAVGYDLYCKLLNEAVQLQKGIAPEKTEEIDTTVECAIDALLPDSYIQDEAEKLDSYKRISSIRTEEDYMDIQDELTDRFGTLPKEAENLLEIAKLKAMARKCCITDVHIGRGEWRLLFTKDADIKVERIPELVKLLNGQLRFSGSVSPMLLFRVRGESWTYEKTIEHAERVIRELTKAPEDGKPAGDEASLKMPSA